ncbi:MAG: beta strand repeat-containing protein [Fimbriiglobus sp.]
MRRFLALIIALILAPPLFAQTTYFWDVNSTTAGFGTAAGTWGTSTNWSTSSAGTATTTNPTTLPTDIVNFGTGGFGLGGGTISVMAGGVDAERINFGSASGAIELTGGQISLGGAATIATFNSAVNTIGSVIAGSGGLTKMGVGTLNLNGGSVYTFTGGLNVNGGTLALNYSGVSDNLINTGNAVSFGGGAIVMTAKSSGTSSQTFGNVTVNSGGGSLLVNPNGGTSMTVTLGTLTTTASGGSFTVGRSVGAGTGTLAITTTTNVGATGIYGGRVVFSNGTAGTGYDWATNTGGGGPFTLSAYAGYSPLTLAGGTDTLNSRVTANATLAASLTTNSLKFENPATAQTLTIATGQTLTLTSGGLLFTGASVTQGPRITGGSITAGNASGSYDLVVHNFNATNFNGAGSPGVANNVSILSAITNNGANPVKLVIAGNSAVTLGGINTFTGGIVINGGSLVLSNGTSGTAQLNNNNITVSANSVLTTAATSAASTTSTGGLILNNGSQLLIVANNGSTTFGGPVTGNGGISIDKAGLGTHTLNLNSTSNSFTGPIRYPHRQQNHQATLNVNSLADSLNPGEGNISFGVTPTAVTGLSNSHNFNYGSAAITPLTLNNRRFELATAQISQSINNESSQALTINSDLLVSGTTGKALTLGGSGAGLSTFAGVISNSAAPITGSTLIGQVTVASGSTSFVLASVEGLTGGQAVPVQTGIVAGTTITSNGINPLTRTITISPATNAALGFGATFTIPGVINSVQITKTGTGTWALTAANTYTGGTVISLGTLSLNSLADGGLASSIGASSNVASNLALANGTTLLYTGIGHSTNRNFTISAATGTIEASGTGILNFTNTASPAYGTTNQTRTLTLGGTSAANNTLAANIDNNGTAAVSVSKTGAGTWVLSGTSTYTGTTEVIGGSLGIGSNAAFGTSTLNLGGTNANTPTIFAIGGARTIANNTVLLATSLGGNPTISGSDNLTITGTVTASGAPRTLTVNNSGSTTLSGNVFLSNDNTTSGRGLTVNGTGNTLISGVIANNNVENTLAATLSKDGAGTLTLGGTNTYTGATSVTEGRLFVNGSTAAGSTVTASGTGLIGGTGTINGSVTVQTGARVQAGNDTTPGGKLTLTTGLAIEAGGTLGVRITAGGTSNVAANSGGSSAGTIPDPTNHNFLEVTGGTFTFDSLSNIRVDLTGTPMNLGETYSYQILQNGSSNLSSINITDLARFQFVGIGGATSPSLVGDATGKLILNFTPVPEPGSMLGIGLLSVGAVMYRRRRSRVL